jgi:hypothetical protein
LEKQLVKSGKLNERYKDNIKANEIIVSYCKIPGEDTQGQHKEKGAVKGSHLSDSKRGQN